MRKLSTFQKERLIRRAIKRHHKCLARRGKIKILLNEKDARLLIAVRKLKSLYPEAQLIYRQGNIVLKAPEAMRLNYGEDTVLQFLKCMRDVVDLPSRSTAVDFSTIKDISPLCAMLLSSEVHRWQLLKGQKLKVLDLENWTARTKKLLHDIGLFELVEVSNPYTIVPVPTEEKYITLRSGQTVDLEKAVSDLEKEVSRIAITLNANPLMYGGIEEAVTNVSQWAYQAFDQTKLENKLRNRWWFFASYNTVTGRMTLMVYDHGGGIPATVPISNWKEAIHGILDSAGIKDWRDEEVIKAVMNLPRSSSGQNYRGKGLRKMKELLERFSKGTLKILSGYGEYSVDQDKKETVKAHKYPIGGTLIVWEVYAEENKYEN